MESHRIHVDKEALKRTSELLGVRINITHLCGALNVMANVFYSFLFSVINK